MGFKVNVGISRNTHGGAGWEGDLLAFGRAPLLDIGEYVDNGSEVGEPGSLSPRFASVFVASPN
jgi:hypothetical protein